MGVTEGRVLDNQVNWMKNKKRILSINMLPSQKKRKNNFLFPFYLGEEGAYSIFKTQVYHQEN